MGEGAADGALLKLDALHSYARVYVDGVLQGVMDRRLGQREVRVSARAGQRLDVLVENSGRINFTTKIRGERAGILGEVSLDGTALRGWEMFPLPLMTPPSSGYTLHGCAAGPCLYHGSLKVDDVGDTYLNTASLGKGVVWVNGHLLGRFWDVGPMGSLYLPGAWLHRGSNDVTVMDLNGGDAAVVRTEDHPVYLQPEAERTTSVAAAKE